MPKETLDHLRSRKKPVLKTLWIPTDDEIASEYNRLEQEVASAEMQAKVRSDDKAASERAAAALMALADYEPVMRKNAIKFVFRSIGRKKFDALLAQHPATDKDRADALGVKEEELAAGNDLSEAELQWSPQTFPMALIAKSMVEPELTEAEILEWIDDDEWGTSEVMTMFTTALQANTTHQLITLGKDSRKTPASS